MLGILPMKYCERRLKGSWTFRIWLWHMFCTVYCVFGFARAFVCLLALHHEMTEEGSVLQLQCTTLQKSFIWLLASGISLTVHDSWNLSSCRTCALTLRVLVMKERYRALRDILVQLGSKTATKDIRKMQLEAAIKTTMWLQWCVVSGTSQLNILNYVQVKNAEHFVKVLSVMSSFNE